MQAAAINVTIENITVRFKDTDGFILISNMTFLTDDYFEITYLFYPTINFGPKMIENSFLANLEVAGLFYIQTYDDLAYIDIWLGETPESKQIVWI